MRRGAAGSSGLTAPGPGLAILVPFLRGPAATLRERACQAGRGLAGDQWALDGCALRTSPLLPRLRRRRAALLARYARSGAFGRPARSPTRRKMVGRPDGGHNAISR